MAADEGRGSLIRTRCLSAFIYVHQRPFNFFSRSHPTTAAARWRFRLSHPAPARFDTPTSHSQTWPSKCLRHPARHLLGQVRSEEHTSELQSLRHLVCRLLLEKK